jgi:alkaline phosphatase D
MMRTRLLRTLLVALMLVPAAVAAEADSIERIAFGSCNKHDAEQPLWQAIERLQPDVWIWTGDIVYGDTEDMALMGAKYDAQKAQPDYARLAASCQIVGIWDDHDYGLNSGGKQFSKRAESQQALLDFLDVPANAPRRAQAGAYGSHMFGSGEQQVQVLLLDARYHRDEPGPDGDILGEAQWAWLEQQLTASRARINILASGIQVLPVQHKYEKWANFPKARERLLELVDSSGAQGVLFVSGDRHIAEISRLHRPGTEPLYDVTSSGMTHNWTKFPGEPNALRVGSVYHQLNFGMLDIDWRTEPVIVDLQIHDLQGAVVRSQRMYVPTKTIHATPTH